MGNDILDLEEFMERVQEDKELLLELFDIFIEDFDKKKQALKEAIEEKDYEQIRNVAHSLKGASGNISAKELRLVVSDMEEMGKKSDIDGIGELFLNMEKQYEVLTGRISEVRIELAE